MASVQISGMDPIQWANALGEFSQEAKNNTSVQIYISHENRFKVGPYGEGDAEWEKLSIAKCIEITHSCLPTYTTSQPLENISQAFVQLSVRATSSSERLSVLTLMSIMWHALENVRVVNDIVTKTTQMMEKLKEENRLIFDLRDTPPRKSQQPDGDVGNIQTIFEDMVLEEYDEQ